MEEKPKPSAWERTTTRRFLRWLFSMRTLRRGLIALAWMVSIIALCYGVTDWRSRHAWNAYRQNYEAHVAPLELQAYVPKPIPDSGNFAATPFVQSWFKTNDTNFLFEHDAWSQAANMVYDPPKEAPSSKYERKFEDLAAWQEAFAAARAHDVNHKNQFQTDKLDLASRAQAAPAVLDGMKDDEAVFDEMRAASARPGARYPVVYDMENPPGILLPHLARIKGACRRLEFKACAELALGQNEKALDDVKLILYLADTLKTEPFLISYLVRIACVHIALVPVWEGLAEQRWTDAQLQQLRGRLEPDNFLADLQWPMHAERAMSVLTVDLLQRKGLGLLSDWGNETGSDKTALNFLGRIVPSGWYDQEKLHYFLRYDDEFQGTMDEAAGRVFPHQITANAAKIGAFATDKGFYEYGTPAQGAWHALVRHEFLAAMLLPPLARIPVKAAAVQVAVDEAAVACALERYRLANGQFPDNLQALVPRFTAHLPNDVITGEPLKYRRADDGRFILYSVGWNEKDDGGVSGKTMFDEAEGDWVW